MYSQEALNQGYLNKKQKLLRIGAYLEISNIKELIVKMYLGEMSCAEIAEDFNNKVQGITITAKGISDEIGRQGDKLGVNYIRNKSDSFKLAIEKGRKTYIIKANKYKRKAIKLKDRYAVMVRDGFKCKLCGSKEQLEVDHIKPISKGGENDRENLQTLCWLCNIGKSQFEK